MCITITTATLRIVGFSEFKDENVICGLRVYILDVECLQLAGLLYPETSNMLFSPCRIQTLTVKEGKLAPTHVEHLIDFDTHNRKQSILFYVKLIVETRAK